MAKASPAALGALLSLALSGPALAANDFRDVAVISATINMVLESERSGVKVNWSNPDTGNSGYVVAERTFFLDPRSPCRDYRRSMRSAGGETVIVTGTGCRTSDGRWELDEQAQTKPAGAEPPRGTATASTGSRRSAVGGSPAGDERPEPPTPLLRGGGETTRSASRTTRVGEPDEPRPEPAAPPAAPPAAEVPGRTPTGSGATAATGRQPLPSTPPPRTISPPPEPVVLQPQPAEPRRAAPEPEPEPEAVAAPAPTARPEPPAPKTPAEERETASSAASSAPAGPKAGPKATSKAEPRVTLRLPSKSEG